MYCKECGSYLPPEATVCPVCGAAVAAMPQQAPAAENAETNTWENPATRPEAAGAQPQPGPAPHNGPQPGSMPGAQNGPMPGGPYGSYGPYGSAPGYQGQPYPPQDPPEPPVRTSEWLWTILLTCIPVVNLVMLFVWGFGNTTKRSKRNWARAQLVITAIGIVLSIVLVVALMAVGASMLYSDWGYGMPYHYYY